MKIKSYISALVLAMLLCCCTQNDGHIGYLFGSWVMTEMTVDGTPKIFPEDDYTTMSFQNDVLKIDYHTAAGQYVERWGTWVRTDNTLQFNFTHSDDKYGPGSAIYAAPEWLDFPQNKIIDLSVTESSGGRLGLVYDTPGGKTIIYKLERTW